MPRQKTNKIAMMALASYLLVGGTGFWGLLSCVFQSWTHSTVRSRANTPDHPVARVVWVQLTDGPSSQKNDASQAAIIVDNEIGSPQEFLVVHFVLPTNLFVSTYLPGLSPRAPPRS